ncbi:hypothetical protein PGB90_008675 [Kerria lacca]
MVEKKSAPKEKKTTKKIASKEKKTEKTEKKPTKKIDKKIEKKTEKKTEKKIEKKIKKKIEKKIGKKVEKKIGKKIEKKIGKKIGKKIVKKTDNKVEKKTDGLKTEKSQKKKVKTAVSKKPSSLAYGKVMFQAFLWRGKWRFINKAEAEKARKKKLAKLAKLKSEKKEIIQKAKKKKRPTIVTKPIKGEKNGEFRKIHLKRKNYYPSLKRPKAHRPRGFYSKHKRFFRPSLTPGTVLILLAGVNKGKRVVLLKNLSSGLLLVTGPYLLNGVPLRRVQQCHVIGTKTKLDIHSLNLPAKLNDQFFKRIIEKKKIKKGEKTIFVPKKKSYQPNAERKELQKVVDKQLLEVIKKHPQKKLLLAYLSAMFGLKNNQYPHRLQF